MAYVINSAITDTFVLRDNSNVALTGKVQADFATAEAFQASAPATTAVVTISEIGNGVYAFSFSASTAETWFAHVVYNAGGVFREFEARYDVLAATVVTAAAATNAAQTTTLTTLRRRVASRLGDYTALVATGNGTTSTLVDTLNVNSGAENYNGCALLFVAGTAGNIGKVARVTTTTDSTGTLQFAPAVASSTATGDQVDCFNRRGLGFRPSDYTFAINQAINDAFPLAVVDLRATIATAFSADAPEVDVPATMTEVYDVEWEDSDGFWHRIPKSTRFGEYGWLADAAAGQIRILGQLGVQADGLTLRLSGYGRQDELSAESDTCGLNAEYIVARACYHLCAGAVTRDASFASLTPLYQKEAEMMKSRIRVIRKPYAEKVRSL